MEQELRQHFGPKSEFVRKQGYFLEYSMPEGTKSVLEIKKRKLA